MQLKINLKDKKRFTILLEWWACMCEVLSLQDFHLQQITCKQNHKPEMLTKIVYILCYVWRGFFTCSRWHHSEASKCIFVCKSHLEICIKELAICCCQHCFKIFPTLKWCVIILLVTHVGWLFSHMKTCHTRKGLCVNVWKGWHEFPLDLSVDQGRSLFTQKNCVCCLCCICISHALRNKIYHEKFPRMLLQINNFLGTFQDLPPTLCDTPFGHDPHCLPLHFFISGSLLITGLIMAVNVAGFVMDTPAKKSWLL